MEIKACPFCGSEDVKYNSLAGCVICKDCHSYGPNAAKEEDAVKKWNAAPRKEDVEMKKSCENCVHISKEVNGKVYCCEKIDINHNCKYWEALNPFGNSRPTCLDCKHRYYSWGGDNICNYCGREIGNPEGYVCDKWEAKGSISTPLKTENSSMKPFINCAKEELIGIRIREPFFNVIQQIAEEAAELAQAALKYGRTKGMGSYTKVNQIGRASCRERV